MLQMVLAEKGIPISAHYDVHSAPAQQRPQADTSNDGSHREAGQSLQRVTPEDEGDGIYL